MARAYVCLARNDLDENLLQVIDLVPNTSLRNFPYTPAGQTGYLTWFAQNEAVATTAGGGGVQTMTAKTYGLAGYLIDVVEDTPGPNLAITAADANTIAAAILTRVGLGLPLTLADVNAAIAATVAGSDLEGTIGASRGTLASVLAILCGEAYVVPAGAQVADAAGAFPAAAKGFFATAPNIMPTLMTGPGGRRSTQPMPHSVPVQTGTEDTGFRPMRVLYDTGDLHRSVLLGEMAKLKSPRFVFENAAFTYGAGGTALTIGGVNIGTTHTAPAVVIYSATGAVI